MALSEDPSVPGASVPIGAALLRHPMGIAGALILVIVTAAALLAPWITSVDPAAIDYTAIRQPPSANYLFGTDEIGRSIYARTVWGARVALVIVLGSVGAAAVVGTALGLVAGHFGGWVDTVVMRVMDTLLAFPTLVLALSIVAILGPSLTNAVIAIALANMPGFARLARGAVLSLRESEFVLAARVLGAGHVRTMLRHLLPNILAQVTVFASLTASAALITESGLSFLGLGVRPPTPSWGQMVAIGMDYWTSWWISFFPGAAIFVTVLGFNLLGDALRDINDPRLKGTR
jgi:ABC-type dipeptide/oligopeptide/nickel transport system permease subunit